MDKPTIQELTRQPLVRGTSCFTDPAGEKGFKTEDLQVSALVRIADALEAQTQMLSSSRPGPGFTAEQWADGLNHLQAVQVKGERTVHIDILGSSPEMAAQLVSNIGAVLKHAVAVAEQQEGGQPS